MKKLLYLSNLRLPTEKAYGIQIAKMCEAFASQVEVKLVYPYRRDPIKKDIFEYYSVKSLFQVKKLPAVDFYFPEPLDKISVGIKSFISAVILVLYALFSKADIIYSRDELVLFFLSFFKNNLIFEAHRFSPKRKFFYSRFKKKGIKIIVISDGLKEDFLKFSIKNSNIFVARDGVDLREFSLPANGEDRKQMQKNLREQFFTYHPDRNRRKKIAVYVGHLYSWKGADILTSAAEHLKQYNDANYLIWIVGGTDKDIETLKKGLHPNIVPFIYPHGRVSHKDVVKVLIAADCAILTGDASEDISAKYTSPLKMFEYMASGCPIVAQDLPSFREVLNDQNSILVKPGDAKALADGINRIFKSLDDDNPVDPDLPIRISKKALEDVQEYTWQKRAEKIIDFISR